MTEKSGSSFQWLVIVAAVMLLVPALGAQLTEDWADSPEAYFLTQQERLEWLRLRSQPQRDAFKTRYWLRRDPTPGTPANEFRDLIQARIKAANKRFKIGETEGASTARGLAFVVFGSPARVTETPVALSTVPQARVGPNDGSESVVVWKYERNRTPKILKMLGRPTLEFTFFIEPERKRDRFEVESLPSELQQIVASRSIVNPDLGDTPTTRETELKLMPLASPSDALSADAAAALQSESGNERVRFGYASLLDERQITAWFFVPDDVQLTNARIAGRVTAPDTDTEVERISLEVKATNELFASERGKSYGVRFPMPAPGSYHAAFALLDGSRTIATATIPKLAIAPADRAEFQISNIVISGSIGPVTSSDAAFTWGDMQIVPRSDSTFRFTESLWYFVQVAHPSSADGLVIEIRLRNGKVWHGEPTRVAAEAGSIGNGLYLIGRELPLMSLQRGSYSLYVTVIDGTNEKVARADFKVLRPD